MGSRVGVGSKPLVLAMLDGHHVLYKVGKRLEERGMVTLLQPGLTRAALIPTAAVVLALFAQVALVQL
jgi:hypothetical protein